MDITGRALVALYWSERKASPKEGATVLAQAFSAMDRAGLSPLFIKARARTRPESQPFIPSEEALADLLSRGANRRDMDHGAIPELGMHVGLWSGGAHDECFSVSALVGSTSPHARNCFLVDLPPFGPFALQRDAAHIRRLFTDLVEVLQPTQGVVCAANAIMWEGARLSNSIPSLAKHGDAV